MIEIRLYAPDKTTTIKDVDSVLMPTASGQIQILPGHADIFTLANGNITIKTGERTRDLDLGSSEIFFSKNILRIFS